MLKFSHYGFTHQQHHLPLQVSWETSSKLFDWSFFLLSFFSHFASDFTEVCYWLNWDFQKTLRLTKEKSGNRKWKAAIWDVLVFSSKVSVTQARINRTRDSWLLFASATPDKVLTYQKYENLNKMSIVASDSWNNIKHNTLQLRLNHW